MTHLSGASPALRDSAISLRIDGVASSESIANDPKLVYFIAGHIDAAIRANPVTKSIANKLEWGIPLESIYESIEKDVKNFKVLINFKILFEVISSGGGNVHTLDSLAGISEKIHNIEKVKREMLQPYVMIGFMLLGITGFVTLMVIDSLTDISIISENDEEKKLALKEQFKERFTLLSMSILVQAYLAGLFLGKIITNTYSGGFRYSAILIVISMGAIALMQSGLFDIQALLGTK